MQQTCKLEKTLHVYNFIELKTDSISHRYDVFVSGVGAEGVSSGIKKPNFK